MSILILKFNKSLSLIDSETIEASESLTIDQYNDTIKSAEGEIGFTISSTNCQIIEIDDPEYCIVIREKVDLTAQGPHDTTIKNRDKRTTPISYKPIDLPLGFIELKGRN